MICKLGYTFFCIFVIQNTKSCVEDKQKRNRNGALRSIIQKLKNRRLRLLNLNIERSRSEIKFNPV
jgi:hypothetical protein